MQGKRVQPVVKVWKQLLAKHIGKTNCRTREKAYSSLLVYNWSVCFARKLQTNCKLQTNYKLQTNCTRSMFENIQTNYKLQTNCTRNIFENIQTKYTLQTNCKINTFENIQTNFKPQINYTVQTKYKLQLHRERYRKKGSQPRKLH